MQPIETDAENALASAVREIREEIAGLGRQLAELNKGALAMIDLLHSIRADGWQVRAADRGGLGNLDIRVGGFSA